MIEIKGKYNTAVCYTPELEETAAEQIKAVCDQAAFSGREETAGRSAQVRSV